MKIRVGNHWYTVEIQDVDSDPVVVLVDGERFEVKLDNLLLIKDGEIQFTLTLGDHSAARDLHSPSTADLHDDTDE